MEKNDLFDEIFKKSQHLSQEQLDREIWQEHGDKVAILVADSTGFTRVTRAKGIVFYLSCIARMRKIALPIFEKHHAINCRAEADNAYATFKTADDAYKASCEVHEVLNKEKIMMLENDPYRLCIGLGYGKVLMAGHEGVYGNEMNLASKLGEDTAEAGEILVTQAFYEELNSDQQKKFSSRDIRVSGVDLSYYHSKIEL